MCSSTTGGLQTCQPTHQRLHTSSLQSVTFLTASHLLCSATYTPLFALTQARNKFFSWWKDWTTLSESDRAKWEAATGQKLVAKDQPESGASGKLV